MELHPPLHLGVVAIEKRTRLRSPTLLFLVWLVQFKEKKRNKYKLSWLALLFKHLFIKIQPNMSDQEKKPQKIYDLLNANTKPKFLCLLHTRRAF